MWELCISEFGMKHREFLFDFSPEQIFLLTNKRAARMERQNPQKQRREGQPMSAMDARMLTAGGFDG